MRAKLFQAIIGVVIVGAFLYFLWIFAKSIYHLFLDWRTSKSLDEMALAFDEKRREKLEQAEQRLDNDCDHDYDDLLHAFPPDVCVKCGLAKNHHAGDCDHVWRRVPGPIPGSRCESCGESFGAAAEVEGAKIQAEHGSKSGMDAKP